MPACSFSAVSAAASSAAAVQLQGRSARASAAAYPSAPRRSCPLNTAFVKGVSQSIPKAAKWSASPLRASIQAGEEAATTPGHPITLTEDALKHVLKLREESGGDGLCLRIGVKQGGCSGMSYHMDFEKEENIAADDMVMDHEEHSFKLVCDTKSLLYLFGMNLDYSHELIGGGFQFHNPNAESSCGCGKSFGA